MKLYEFQGKALFREAGIPIPRGALVTADSRKDLFAPSAVKAQVLSGGRGKAGGVLLVSNMEEAEKAADSILSLELKGEKVSALLVEEKMDIRREYYLAVTFDGEARTPLFMVSPSGGIWACRLSSSRARARSSQRCQAEPAILRKSLSSRRSVTSRARSQRQKRSQWA